jgi:hypothetical protein
VDVGEGLLGRRDGLFGGLLLRAPGGQRHAEEQRRKEVWIVHLGDRLP